jgi:RNA polymerase sigma factor (sigma-70 family)
MTRDARVPSTKMTGVYGGLVKMMARRMLGDVPDSAGVLWNYPAVFKDVMGFGRKADKWNRLDPHLASFAAMAAAATVGCSFCLDFGYFMVHNKGLDEAKAREVPRWRDEPHRPRQRRAGHPVAGILCELRSSASCRSLARRGRLGMSDDPFVAHRSLLFTVAYEMLGSASDAEGVVQESGLRWFAADQSGVRDPRAFLVRIVTRKALDRLRTLARRREDYVGPWLPEPLLTGADVAEDVELAESLSMAMLLVLETLTPTERAVFALREVFDLDYDELAAAIDKSPAAVRQIAHRARAHVAARRPCEVVSRAQSRAAFDAFMRAIETGDLQRLVDVLAPDVVALSDGGGADAAQRLAGAAPAPRRAARQCGGGPVRRRPRDRAVLRAQPREAVACGAGGCGQSVSPASGCRQPG